ncbi:hypothetical protein SEA_NEDARYA_88 [Gordonia phage Nedarya]|nr:hypothetical protein SEA_NEDARYA_88 [Gordonia phage Nedarya]
MSITSNLQASKVRLDTALGELRRLNLLLEEARPSLTTDEFEELEHTLGLATKYATEARETL